MSRSSTLVEAIQGAPALEAKGVLKRYEGRTVLDRVDLRIEAGEFVALVGESGAGKTTLLRMFNRTVDPDEGLITVGGREAASINPVRLRRSIGYVQQEGGLLPHWDVLRNVALVPWLNREGDAGTRAAAALRRVGLDPSEFGHRLPTELSGGQRQRVALARALAGDPRVVLLDEPFRALDAITRSELVETVRSVLNEVGVTAVVVTHDLRNALRIADRIVVLRAGVIEQVGSGEELCSAEACPYVKELLERAGVAAGASGP